VTGGEALAGIILRLASMGHSILNSWVNVTNATGDGEGQFGFAVLPAGVGVAQWAASMVELYASLIAQLSHVPKLVDSMVTLLVALM